MPGFSSIKLSNNKALSAKKSLEFEQSINEKPIKVNIFLQKNLSPNSTKNSPIKSQLKSMVNGLLKKDEKTPKNNLKKSPEEIENSHTLERLIKESTHMIFEKNLLIEDIVKEKNLNIIGAPILEIGIKQRGSRSMNEADSFLKTEMTSHLEKEIALDTLRKTKDAENILNKNTEKILKKCGDELKKQVAEDVLKEIKHDDILDKARAAAILERIGTTDISEKEMVKRVFIMVAKEYMINENFDKLDAVRALDETNISDIFNFGAEKLQDMIENHKERLIAQRIFENSLSADLEDKKKASGSADRAIEEMKKAERELKRELEKTEYFAVHDDQEKDFSKEDDNKGQNETSDIFKDSDYDHAKNAEAENNLKGKQAKISGKKTNLRKE